MRAVPAKRVNRAIHGAHCTQQQQQQESGPQIAREPGHEVKGTGNEPAGAVRIPLMLASASQPCPGMMLYRLV